MAPPRVAALRGQANLMEAGDRERIQAEHRKAHLKRQAQIEAKNSKFNLNKIQESWLKIMRSAKTKELKKEVETISQNHERDVDRKDAVLQMLDRDLDEAEEQHQVAVRSHLLNLDKLHQIQTERIESLEEEFKEDVKSLEEEFNTERSQLLDRHALEKRELTILIQQIMAEEKNKEAAEETEHQSQYEVIRNKNIELDHQMKSHLDEKIDNMKDRCNQELQKYRTTTEANTADYKSFLQRDASLSKQVERKLRQVERMQASITHWKMKISQNRSECEERNVQLRTEKEQIAKHFQELKAKMSRFRQEEKKRLTDLTINSKNCVGSLKEQLGLADRILKTAELCRKLETEREKVLPFYISREPDVDELPFDGQEALRDEIKDALQENNSGIDEWTYLDTFFKRYNKVLLDTLAIEKEKSRLETENGQLRSILKQFLDGVSVNEDVLSAPNPLFVVNGRVNLNHVPVMRADKKTVVEAAHHVSTRPVNMVANRTPN